MYWNRRLGLLYSYVLAKTLQNGVKSIQILTPAFKNHMRNLDIFRKAKESPKNWNLMGLFLSKKYIPSAKTLYTKYLSNITFNYLCEYSPNY